MPIDARKKTSVIGTCGLVSIALGLTCLGLWTNVLSSSGAIFEGTVGLGGLPSEAFLAGRLGCALAVIPLASLLRKGWGYSILLACLSMSFSGVLCSFAGHQDLMDPLFLIPLSVVIGSMGYSIATASFYILLAERAGYTSCALTIAVSLVLETILSASVAFAAPVAVQSVMVSFSPILALACFALARLALERGEVSTGQAQVEVRDGRLSPMARLLIYTVALVLVKALSNVGIWGSNRGSYLGFDSLSVPELAAISAAIMVMAAVVYVIPGRASITARSVGGLAIVVAGLQLIALTGPMQLGESFDASIAACESFGHLVMWMAFIECVRTTRTPAYRLSGYIYVVYVITTALTSMIIDRGMGTTAFIMVAVYVLLMLLIATLVMATSKARMSSDTKQPATEAALPFHRRPEFGTTVERLRLSEREAQIAILLANGLKRQQIETELGVSEGTVRTHISRMYRKLGVHSRDELVELLRRQGAEE